MILPHPNNGTTSFFTLLHQSPFPLRTNVAPKLLEAPPQSQSSGFRVSDAIVLARRREEVRGIVGERWLREIGSWQLGFAMETRRLPRVPRPNPKGHCLWWCSHPLLNRFTFCSTLSNWVFFGFLLTSVWNEGKRVENKSFKKSTSSFHSLFNKTEEKTSLSVFSFFLFIYDKISYAIIQP